MTASRASAIALAVVVLSAGLTGCIGDEETAGRDPAGPSEPADENLLEGSTLRGCSEHFGFFTIPEDQADPYLPEGFEVIEPTGGLQPEGRAQVDVLVYTCQAPESEATSHQVWISLYVDPPEEHRGADVTYHYIHVAGLTDDPVVRDAMAAWGIPRLEAGELEVERAGTPIVDQHTATATDGEVTLTLETAMAGPGVSVPGGTMRVFGVQERRLTGAVDVAYTSPTTVTGGATLEDDGLVPFDIDEQGIGGVATGMDLTYTPVLLATSH